MTRAMLSHCLEHTRAIFLLGALTSVLVLQGCSDKPDPKDKKDESQTTAQDESNDTSEEIDGSEAEAEPIKAADIQPEFMEFGPVDMSPDQLIINTKVNLLTGELDEGGETIRPEHIIRAIYDQVGIGDEPDLRVDGLSAIFS